MIGAEIDRIRKENKIQMAMGRNMKKKNKKISLVSQTVYMLVIQSILLAIVVVTYICVSYYTNVI